METARQLFFQQGYSATGIAQILQTSGSNSGSLYYFFPTKEDLLVAVLEQYKEMLQTHVIGPAHERAAEAALMRVRLPSFPAQTTERAVQFKLTVDYQP